MQFSSHIKNDLKIIESKIFITLSSFKPNPLILLSLISSSSSAILFHTHAHTNNSCSSLSWERDEQEHFISFKNNLLHTHHGLLHLSFRLVTDETKKTQPIIRDETHEEDTCLILYLSSSKHSCSYTFWFTVIDEVITESMTFWHNLLPLVSAVAEITSAQYCHVPFNSLSRYGRNISILILNSR